MIEIPISETTWLEGITNVSNQQTADGPILFIELINGHRYAIPLTNPQVRSAIHRIASPITIAGLSVNGSGTSSSSD